MIKIKKNIFILSISCIALLLFSCQSNTNNTPEGWKLIWSDEFNGKALDLKKWDYQLGTGSQYGLDGWGNQEAQYYTKENISLAKGMLVIEAKKEAKNGKTYTSSRVRTVKEDGTILFATTYGRVEARIKLPIGNGIWPAFWMLPASDTYGNWASSGEIDIMEFRGRLPNRSYANLHYGEEWPGNKYSGSLYKYPEGSDGSDFHIYAIEWEPGIIRWYVDDSLFYETSSWWGMAPEADEPYDYPAPYDAPFYILLNLAIGGAFDEYRLPSDSEIPAKMYVDYVRVYEKTAGYNYNVSKPIPERDEKNFALYRKTDQGSFVIDPLFKTLNSDALSTNTMDVQSGQWYTLALAEFGGSAKTSVENDACHIHVQKEGNEVHSVQLLQHHGIAKGYTYLISFDAKSDKDRKIAVKIGGDDDNAWAVYSSQYAPQLTNEYAQYKYRLTMENESDPSARLEFNVGKEKGDVWLKNITVTRIDF